MTARSHARVIASGSDATVRSCAICAGLVADDPPRREPLGKGGASVIVCAACATESPIARTGPDRGYEPTGGMPSVAEIRAGARWAMGKHASHEARIARSVFTSIPKAADVADAFRAEGARLGEALRRQRISSKRVRRSPIDGDGRSKSARAGGAIRKTRGGGE